MKSSIKKIRNNIQKFGYHAYLVSGGDIPTFSYTIGLRNVVGKEIILAGGAYYSADAVFEIIATLARRYLRGEGINDTSFSVDQIGQFDLRPVHQSWVRQLMLGALDYYNNETVPAVQVCPDDGHRTIDVPDMSVGFSPCLEPVWKWALEPWKFPVPRNSVALTNLAALRGQQVTEAARWEIDHWEIFAGPGPDVDEGEVRAVPLGTVIGFDPSAESLAHLDVGEARWRREGETAWREWRAKD